MTPDAHLVLDAAVLGGLIYAAAGVARPHKRRRRRGRGRHRVGGLTLVLLPFRILIWAGRAFIGPRPAKDQSYEAMIHSAKWKAQRERTKARDGWRCLACGSSAGMLHSHHSVYHHPRGTEPDDSIYTLCEYDHRSVHSLAGHNPSNAQLRHATETVVSRARRWHRVG